MASTCQVRRGARHLTRPMTPKASVGHPGSERRVRPRPLADDPTAIARRDAAVALGEYRRQLPCIRRRQPQPEQMPLALRVEPVLIAGARVQDRVVVQELDVARHEFMSSRSSRRPPSREHVQRLESSGVSRRASGNVVTSRYAS